MTITAILGNSQRLDGGAMFGNAPKALWSRWIVPDEQNRIPLACRTMLVNDGSRRILCETGIGAFFDPTKRERYGVVEERHVLLEGLAQRGLSHKDINVVILSHLHFDHAGGILSAWKADHEPELLFPNAKYLVSAAAFERAKKTHSRDRASFIPGLAERLEATGRLELISAKTSPDMPGWHFHYFDGHTPGLLVAEYESVRGPVVFASDLIPGVPWVHLPITMGYDRFPELLIDEKERLLSDLCARGGWLFFTHDPQIALGRVSRDSAGKFGISEQVEAPESWGGAA